MPPQTPSSDVIGAAEAALPEASERAGPASVIDMEAAVVRAPVVPESRLYRLKTRLLGPPLSSETLEHQRLGKPTALAVFASDNLSSAAYATE